MIKIDDESVKVFDRNQALRDTVCEFMLQKSLLNMTSRFSRNDSYVHKNTIFNKLKAFVNYSRMRDADYCLFYVSYCIESVEYGQSEKVNVARIDSTNSSKETIELINEFSKYLDEKGWKVFVKLYKDKYIPCKLKRKK